MDSLWEQAHIFPMQTAEAGDRTTDLLMSGGLSQPLDSRDGNMIQIKTSATKYPLEVLL